MWKNAVRVLILYLRLVMSSLVNLSLKRSFALITDLCCQLESIKSEICLRMIHFSTQYFILRRAMRYSALVSRDHLDTSNAGRYIEISLGNSCDNLFGVLQLREFDLSVKFTFVLI